MRHGHKKDIVLEKNLWGNGIGTELKLWYKKPIRFHKIRRSCGDEIYVPIKNKYSCYLNGGTCTSKKGTVIDCECITCISKNYKEVVEFTEASQQLIKNAVPEFDRFFLTYIKKMIGWQKKGYYN